MIELPDSVLKALGPEAARDLAAWLEDQLRDVDLAPEDPTAALLAGFLRLLKAQADRPQKEIREPHATYRAEGYATEAFDITQTQTWQLCGTLEITEPDPKYVVGHNEQGQVITNYAEHVDDVVYRREL